MTTELVVLANPKPKYQRSSFFPPRVHDTIRSDQLTDETGSLMSPKRRTLWGTPRVRVSAGQQHIACLNSVKQDFAQFCKNLPWFGRELSRPLVTARWPLATFTKTSHVS